MSHQAKATAPRFTAGFECQLIYAVLGYARVGATMCHSGFHNVAVDQAAARHYSHACCSCVRS